jgi:hypothetical protein
MKNIEELKLVVRTALFEEMLEKTKTCSLIWKEFSPGQYVAEYESYQFYISQPASGTFILDILKDEKLYRNYNSNFNSLILDLYREIDYFIIQEKLNKHRTVSNVVSAAVPVDTPEIKLFDELSWQGIVPEPYARYLSAAKTRWENFVKYNPAAIDGIKSFFPTWNGLRLNSYTEINSGSTPMIASCGVYEYVDLQTATAGVQFNSVSFNLTINKYFESSFDEFDWINVLTHEMGHALGIGIFWNAYFAGSGSIPPSNDFLSSAYYHTQEAYNQMAGLDRDRVPLESTGGAGTSSAHWENNYRLSSAAGTGGVDYYGFENEMMIGYYSSGLNLLISNMSIKHLVDLGYNEINRGSNEGYVEIINNLSFYAQNMKKFHCSCDFGNMVKIGTVKV